MKRGSKFMDRLRSKLCMILICLCVILNNFASQVPVNATEDSSVMYKNSEFIEKEQPELTEETKKIISAYQKEQSMENYLKLRDEVIKNYNAVLDKKEQKLAELIEETKGKPNSNQLVQEMQEIVQEMYITYWNRINSSMLRFTDSRLSKWKISNASNYEYIPVMGAGTSIYIKRTPVTNKEYAVFIKETGYQPPSNWSNGKYAPGEDDLPVNYVSYKDAEEYAKWLTLKDSSNTYRLPTESEWELAAGHMPKDADFNNGVNNERTSVYEYADRTRGAHGAVDFWGNVWEWTSTQRDNSNNLAVKGGSWKSPRTDSRTEHRQEGRDKNQNFDDVGFRIIQVTDGKEPEQKAGLYTLDAPKLTSKNENGNLILSWSKVDKAVEYQIFEYDETTKLFKMINRVTDTSYKIEKAQTNKNYVIQALSYTAISDNVRSNNETQNNAEDSTITTKTVENTDGKNHQVYYVIGGIASLFIICGIILGITTKKRK